MQLLYYLYLYLLKDIALLKQLQCRSTVFIKLHLMITSLTTKHA